MLGWELVALPINNCVTLGKKKSFLSECFIFPQSEEPQMEVFFHRLGTKVFCRILISKKKKYSNNLIIPVWITVKKHQD